jgi:hypothetical protein
MLAAVEFSFAKDDQGRVIDFTPQFTAGLTQYFFPCIIIFSCHLQTHRFSSVMVFPCNISPRSHIHSELVDLL